MLQLQQQALAQIARADDFIVSDKLVSLMMSQLSENKNLHKVFKVLFSSEGSEIYIRPMTDYITLGSTVDSYTVREARLMLRAAEDANVVTQMGNTGHSSDDARTMVEMLWAGALGVIREVHVWTNRPIWPQGIARPETKPVPKHLNWDLWLGPAPQVPYNDGIHPFGWRGYSEYGTGAIGDMGAHQLDFVFRALSPGLPTRIEARHSPWGGNAATRQRGNAGNAGTTGCARGERAPGRELFLGSDQAPELGAAPAELP